MKKRKNCHAKKKTKKHHDEEEFEDDIGTKMVRRMQREITCTAILAMGICVVILVTLLSL